MNFKLFLSSFLLFGLIFSSTSATYGAEELQKEVTLGSSREIEATPSATGGEEGGGGREGSVQEESFVPSDEGVPLRESSEISLEKGLRLNLHDCIKMALLNNKEIKAKNYDVEAAEWKLKEAQPHGVPTIEYEFISAPAPRDVDRAVASFFEGNITYFQKGKISVGSPLYTFGKIGIAQDLAKRGILAEKHKRVEKQNDIVLKVSQLYYGQLLAKDMRKLLKDAIGHLESEINRGRTSDEPQDPVRLVRLKLYRYEVLSRISKLEKKDLLAKHALRIVMGLPRGTEYEIVGEHIKPVDYELRDFESYLVSSRKFRPKNRLLEIGLKAKELQYRLEKRKLAPDIGIGGIFEFGVTTNPIQGLQLTDDFNDPFNYTRVGVGLRIQGKLNIKSYREKVKQAQAEYFKTAFNKGAADEGLELDLREAYLTVQQEEKNVENAREAMKTSRQYVFLTKTNVDIGVGSKKDYSEALQAYLLSQGKYLETVFNYNVAVAVLEQKAGGVAQIKE